MHNIILYIYVDLREVKAILDERVRKRGMRAGQFSSKEKVTSSPSTPIPSNPVDCQQCIKLVHMDFKQVVSREGKLLILLDSDLKYVLSSHVQAMHEYAVFLLEMGSFSNYTVSELIENCQ